MTIIEQLATWFKFDAHITFDYDDREYIRIEKCVSTPAFIALPADTECDNVTYNSYTGRLYVNTKDTRKYYSFQCNLHNAPTVVEFIDHDTLKSLG